MAKLSLATNFDAAFNPLRFNQPKRNPLKGKDLENFKVYSKKIWKNIEEI